MAKKRSASDVCLLLTSAIPMPQIRAGHPSISLKAMAALTLCRTRNSFLCEITPTAFPSSPRWPPSNDRACSAKIPWIHESPSHSSTKNSTTTKYEMIAKLLTKYSDTNTVEIITWLSKFSACPTPALLCWISRAKALIISHQNNSSVHPSALAFI